MEAAAAALADLQREENLEVYRNVSAAYRKVTWARRRHGALAPRCGGGGVCVGSACGLRRAYWGCAPLCAVCGAA